MLTAAVLAVIAAAAVLSVGAAWREMPLVYGSIGLAVFASLLLAIGVARNRPLRHREIGAPRTWSGASPRGRDHDEA